MCQPDLGSALGGERRENSAGNVRKSIGALYECQSGPAEAHLVDLVDKVLVGARSCPTTICSWKAGSGPMREPQSVKEPPVIEPEEGCAAGWAVVAVLGH